MPKRKATRPVTLTDADRKRLVSGRQIWWIDPHYGRCRGVVIRVIDDKWVRARSAYSYATGDYTCVDTVPIGSITDIEEDAA